MVGRSGAGKGTQAKKLAEQLGFFYWEMGGLIRSEIDRQTAIGKEIESLVNKGLFLDDEHLLKVVENHLDEIPKDKGIIFDGIPRRLHQAYYMVGLLRGMGRKSMATIYVDVSRETALERLLERSKIEGRKDDNIDAIGRRLDQYEIETMPVVEYLKRSTTFFTIDGKPPVEVVWQDLSKQLGLQE